ncbi:glycosyltransferase family 4 protein [Microvirga sp. VF16]|uniref:glycosyltransferase family 4 protein n=1 Tax=Microvirga sp. VF16 TaxID=2807101 RepID=UPI00193E8356|nr:glycosyltransferase family 4 protein [Microvirga sp. VF16]QRM33400.1 glycosyltransferase family 4 protein [Microvirga sp. VF16]
MKICVLGLRGMPHVSGGIEMHCEQLFPRLKKRRPEDQFTVIGRRSYCPNNVSEFDGVRIVALAHARGKYLETISNALIGLLYARFRLHAEILHIHAIGPALVAPLAKMLGMKVLVTHHGADYNRARWNVLAKTVLRAGEFCAVHFADHIISVSPSAADHLRRRYRSRSSRISFIPNGSNHMTGADAGDGANQSVLLRYGLNRRNYIITVGRLVPEKGVETLIHAYRGVPHPSNLVVVGGASSEDRYAEYLHRESDERVIFTGALDPVDIRVLLANAALFVLASRHEGLAIAALEAAASGCPALLSDIQANLDLGLPTTNYFRTGDEDDLRKKLSAPHQAYLVPSTSVLHNYDWDRISDETSAVYEELRQRPAEGALNGLIPWLR